MGDGFGPTSRAEWEGVLEMKRRWRRVKGRSRMQLYALCVYAKGGKNAPMWPCNGPLFLRMVDIVRTLDSRRQFGHESLDCLSHHAYR